MAACVSRKPKFAIVRKFGIIVTVALNIREYTISWLINLDPGNLYFASGYAQRDARMMWQSEPITTTSTVSVSYTHLFVLVIIEYPLWNNTAYDADTCKRYHEVNNTHGCAVAVIHSLSLKGNIVNSIRYICLCKCFWNAVYKTHQNHWRNHWKCNLAEGLKCTAALKLCNLIQCRSCLLYTSVLYRRILIFSFYSSQKFIALKKAARNSWLPLIILSFFNTKLVHGRGTNCLLYTSRCV